MQSLSSQFATWIGVISAIVGGVLALQAYREDVAKRADDRVVGAFERIERFNAPAFRAIRDDVVAEVFARRICDVRAEALEFTLNEAYAYVDFFDLTHLCVETGLCDAGVVADYFAPYANNVWSTAQPFIERVRAIEAERGASSRFGAGLERFAAAPTPPNADCQANFTGVFSWEQIVR